MKLYIIGFSSAGKSTLAKALAATWSIPHWDTDEIFEREHAQSIADYVQEKGWEAFRKAESDILLKTQSCLSGSESSFSEIQKPEQYEGIVACGGGIVDTEINRSFLAEQRLLWLNPPWKLLLSRIRKHPSAFCANKSEHELYNDFRRRCILYSSLFA